MLAGDSNQVTVEDAMQLAQDACQHSEQLQVSNDNYGSHSVYVIIASGPMLISVSFRIYVLTV